MRLFKGLSFEECKARAQEIGFIGQRDYRAKAKEFGLPVNPDKTFKEEWTHWKEYLGNEFPSFEECKVKAQRIGFAGQVDYQSRAKSLGLPTNPPREFKDQWSNWFDYLGKYSKTQQQLFDISQRARELGIKNERQWRGLFDEGIMHNGVLKPGYQAVKEQYPELEGVYADMSQPYKGEGWKGWGDFLCTSKASKRFLARQEYVRKNLTMLLAVREQLQTSDVPSVIASILSSQLSDSQLLSRYTTHQQGVLHRLAIGLDEGEVDADTALSMVDGLIAESESLAQALDAIEQDTEINLDDITEAEHDELIEEKAGHHSQSKEQLLEGANSRVSEEEIESVRQEFKLPFENAHLCAEAALYREIMNWWYQHINLDFPQLNLNREIDALAYAKALETVAGINQLKPRVERLNLDKTAHPFQLASAYQFEKTNKLFNMSEPGTGKTFAVVLSCLLLLEKNPNARILLINPSNKLNKQTEDVFLEYLPAENLTSIYPTQRLCLGFSLQSDEDVGYRFAVDNGPFDLVVVDEVHNYKPTTTRIDSNRRSNLIAMLGQLKSMNPDTGVIFLSATPLKNRIEELTELILMLDDSVEWNNEHLISQSQRWVAENSISARLHLDVDIHTEIINHTLTQADFDAHKHLLVTTSKNSKGNRCSLIRALSVIDKMELKAGDVCYSYWQGNAFNGVIEEAVRQKCINAGLSFSSITGTTKDGEDLLRAGNPSDVLFISKAAGEGVDGIQKVYQRLHFISYPYTFADKQQIIGRLYRRGREGDVVVVEHAITECTADFAAPEMLTSESERSRVARKQTLTEHALKGLLNFAEDEPQTLLNNIDQSLQDR